MPQTINHKSLVDQVAEALEKQILDGLFKPGERLIEMALSEKYNVSRTCVREAMRILESRGFVHSVPRKGVSVAKLSAKECYDIYVIRANLESLAIKLAIEQQDPEVLKRLKCVLKKMEQTDRDDDLDKYREWDMEFHQIYNMACGNEQLVRLVESLARQTARYRAELFMTAGRIGRSLEAHAVLVGFFERNEPEKGEAFRRQTMLQFADEVREWIEKNEGQPD